MGWHKIVTPDGYEFEAMSVVEIGDHQIDMDDMTPEQRQYVATKLTIQGLNAAYAGERRYFPETPLPSFKEVFPDLAV